MTDVSTVIENFGMVWCKFEPVWEKTSKILTAGSPSGSILVTPVQDYGWNLQYFCGVLGAFIFTSNSSEAILCGFMRYVRFVGSGSLLTGHPLALRTGHPMTCFFQKWSTSVFFIGVLRTIWFRSTFEHLE